MRTNNIIKILFWGLLCLLLSCRGTANKQTADKQIITVSIEPLKYIVETIAGDDFDVEVIVPSGSSPESYSPTPKQMSKISDSKMVVYLGTLSFEKEIISRLSSSKANRINLTDSGTIDIIREHECEESTEDNIEVHIGKQNEQTAQNKHNQQHSHAVDPHIWLSVRNLQAIAERFGKTLSELYPDSTKYGVNTLQFIELLKMRDAEYTAKLSTAPTRTFLIYHPALSYLARDYGLTQLSVEDEGKDPTPSSVSAVVDQARLQRVDYIMYQKEFSFSAVRSIVEETGIKAFEINPLSENVIGCLDEVVNIISTGSND